MKALIVYGGWDGHQPKEVSEVLEKGLKAKGFQVQRSDKLDPLADGEALKKLDLVVPIRPQHAWLLHATSDGCRTNYSHYTPKGTGSVWDSRAVINCGLTGTFIPQVWLGDDERGLAWWAGVHGGAMRF